MCGGEGQWTKPRVKSWVAEAVPLCPWCPVSPLPVWGAAWLWVLCSSVFSLVSFSGAALGSRRRLPRSLHLSRAAWRTGREPAPDLEDTLGAVTLQGSRRIGLRLASTLAGPHGCLAPLTCTRVQVRPRRVCLSFAGQGPQWPAGRFQD